MKSIDAVTKHLNALDGAPKVLQDEWWSNAMNVFFNPAFVAAASFPLGILAGLMGAKAMLGEPIGWLYWMTAGAYVFLGITSRILAHKLVGGVCAHASQWDQIVAQSEAIVALNPAHSDIIASIVQLMGDERVSYKWATQLNNLLSKWVESEKTNKVRQNQLERIEVLKNGATEAKNDNTADKVNEVQVLECPVKISKRRINL